MHISCLKTLTPFIPNPFPSRPRIPLPLFASFYLPHLTNSRRRRRLLLLLLLPRLFCSLSDDRGSDYGAEGKPPNNQVSRTTNILQVVLVSPQIPGNTGCIARSCAESAIWLHLVGPMGFQIDDAKLKRAGLDYWPYVVVKVHSSWAEFQDYFRQQDGEKRLLAFTKRGTQVHSDFSYRRGDYLLFGAETSGLPPEALNDCKSGPFGGGTLRIPMVETYVRCLNLSASVGIALYEASRQLNYEQLQLPLENCIDSENSIVTEIFSYYIIVRI